MNSNGSANSGALSFIRLILHARRNVEYLASDHGKPHGGEYQLFFFSSQNDSKSYRGSEFSRATQSA